MNNLNVIRIANPLNPAEHTRESAIFRPGQSIADLFPDVVGAAHPWAITLNGKVVDPEDRAATYPSNGDFVTICPVPAGGDGDGKSIVRLVAMIAVIAISNGAFGWEGLGSMAAGTAGLSGATWSAVFTVAGTMLVNAMLPPAAAKRHGSESPSYGYDGAKNTSAEGVVVPVCYGQFRMGGNIIANHVVNDGNSQILYMLINAGEGPVASLTMPEVNDQPIENFQDYELLDPPRLGTVDQDPTEWFASSITPVNLSGAGEFVTAWKTFTVGTPGTDVFDRMRLDIVAPYGLCEIGEDDGATLPRSVDIEIQYRAAGTSDPWVGLELTNETSGYVEQSTYVDGFDSAAWIAAGGTIHREDDVLYIFREVWVNEGTSISRVNVGMVQMVPMVYGGGASTLQISASQRSAYRRSLMTPALPQGAYEIRYRRTTEPDTAMQYVLDRLYLTDVNKIIDEKVAYIHTALFGLKIRLSEQLNGLPKVTYINGGRLIKVWDPITSTWKTEASSNPAWITWDILTSKRIGAGIPESRLDFHRWVDWASYCYQEGFEFHGVLDVVSNVWDAISMVSRCGRAQIMRVGTRYSVAIEREDVPVQTFSVANMVAGTFKQTWTGLTDRANEIEMTFADKEDGYKGRTVRLYDSDALAAGQPQRVAQVEMKGVVESDRAYREMKLMLNLNRWVRCSVEFGAMLDGIVCRPGDLINVQHDMPQWGYGGRTEAGSTTSVIQLDRPVTIDGDLTYQVLLHMDSVLRRTDTVHSIAGDNVILNGYDGANNVKRLVFGALDRRIDGIVQSGTRWGVSLDDVSGITVGSTVYLYDTNVMDVRNVVNPVTAGQVAEVTQVTLASPVAAAPQQFTKWLFGQTNKVAKPFRVVKIVGSHDYRRDISAIEYFPEVYSDLVTGPPPNYSDLNARIVNHVTIEGATEQSRLVDTIFQTSVTVAFKSNQQTYKEGEVFVSRNGGPFTSEGRDRGALTVSAYRGDTLIFKVVAWDAKGRNSGYVGAPEHTHVVVGAANQPPNVTGFDVNVVSVGLQAVWDRWDSPIAGDTEIRIGTVWATASPLFRGKADRYTAIDPEPGTYPLLAKHWDVTGQFESTVATPFTVNWDGTDLVDVLTLTAPTQIFRIDPEGDSEPESIVLTASSGFTGSPSFSVIAGTYTTGPVLGGSGNTRTIVPDNMVTDTITVEVAWGGQTDQITLYKIFDGSSAYQAGLENEAQTIPCSSDGTPISGLPVLSKMIVVHGTSTLTSGVTYSCVASSGFGGTPADYIDAVTGDISIPSITDDFASAKFRATIAGGPVLDRVLTASKAIAGASAQGISLHATSFAFIFAGQAATISNSPDIVFTAWRQNVTASVSFTATAYDEMGVSLGPVTLTSLTANSATLTSANFNAAGATTVRRVSVTATAGIYTDTMTIYRADNGSDAIQARLSNEAHTVPADSSGNVLSYTGADGEIEAYRGLERLTSGTSPSVSFALAPGGNPQGLTYTLDSVTGAYAVTAMPVGISVATLRMRATLSSGQTLDCIFTITKTRNGSSGARVSWVPRDEIVLPMTDLGAVASYSDAWSDLLIEVDGLDDTANWTLTPTYKNVSGTLTGNRAAVTAFNSLGGLGSAVQVADLDQAAAGWGAILRVYHSAGVWIATGSLLAGAPYNYIFRSTDYVNWTMVDVGAAGKWCVAAWAQGAWVLAQLSNNTTSNQARRSTDGGLTWTGVTLSTPATTQLSDLVEVDGHLVACPHSGTLGSRSTDGGATWSPITLPGSGTSRLWAGAGIWLLLTQNGVAHISTNQGSSWTNDDANWPTDPIEAVAYKGRLVVSLWATTNKARYREPGGTWVTVTLPQTMNASRLVIVSDVLWMLENSGSKSCFTTDGKTWRQGGLKAGGLYAWSRYSIPVDFIPYYDTGYSTIHKQPLLATSDEEGAITVEATKSGANTIVTRLPVRKGSVQSSLYGLSANPGVLILPATSDGVVTSFASATIALSALKDGVPDPTWTFSWVAPNMTPSSGTGSTITFTGMSSAHDSATITITASSPGQVDRVEQMTVTKNKGTEGSGPRILGAFAAVTTNSTYVAIRFTSDGRVLIRRSSSGAWGPLLQWGGVIGSSNASYWMKVIRDPGSHAFDSGTEGTYVSMATDQDYVLSDSSPGPHVCSFDVSFAEDALGTNEAVGQGSLKIA